MKMMDLGRRDFFAKFTRDDLYLVPPTVYIYMSTIYTPNLGSGVAVLGQERKHGRF